MRQEGYVCLRIGIGVGFWGHLTTQEVEVVGQLAEDVVSSAVLTHVIQPELAQALPKASGLVGLGLGTEMYALLSCGAFVWCRHFLQQLLLEREEMLSELAAVVEEVDERQRYSARSDDGAGMITSPHQARRR